MEKCIVCGEPIPEKRRRKDTCSGRCGLKKMAAWAAYISAHKSDLMKEALKELG